MPRKRKTGPRLTRRKITRTMNKCHDLPAHADVVMLHEDESPVHVDVIKLHEDVSPVQADVVMLHEDVSPVHADAMLHEDESPVQADVVMLHEDVSPVHADVVMLHEDVSPVHADAMLHEDESPSHADVVTLHEDESPVHIPSLLYVKEETQNDDLTTFTNDSECREDDANFNSTSTTENAESFYTEPTNGVRVKIEDLDSELDIPSKVSSYQIETKVTLPKTLICQITTKNPLKLEYCCGFCSLIITDLDELRLHLVFMHAHQQDELEPTFAVIQTFLPGEATLNSHNQEGSDAITGIRQAFHSDKSAEPTYTKQVKNDTSNTKMQIKVTHGNDNITFIDTTKQEDMENIEENIEESAGLKEGDIIEDPLSQKLVENILDFVEQHPIERQVNPDRQKPVENKVNFAGKKAVSDIPSGRLAGQKEKTTNGEIEKKVKTRMTKARKKRKKCTEDNKTTDGNQSSGKRFPGKQQLNRKQYQCELCPSVYRSSTSLRVHYLKHEKKKPFQCTSCPMQFYTSTALKSHSSVHSDNLDYACHVCDRKFKQKRGLKSHIRIHEDHRKKYKCPHCELDLTHRTNLRRHIKTQHSDEASFKGEYFTCGICEAQFFSDHVLQSHMRKHTGIVPFQCDTCKESCGSKASLAAHITKMHPEVYGPCFNREKKMFECDICFKVFHYVTSFKQHLDIHSKPFLCNICGAALGTNAALQIHLNRHSGTKLPCDICKKQFGSKFTLWMHIQITHERKRTGICSICGLHFTNKGLILRHMRRKHPEHYVLRYNCKMCPVVFKSQGYLDRHVIFKHTNTSEDMKTNLNRSAFSDINSVDNIYATVQEQSIVQDESELQSIAFEETPDVSDYQDIC